MAYNIQLWTGFIWQSFFFIKLQKTQAYSRYVAYIYRHRLFPSSKYIAGKMCTLQWICFDVHNVQLDDAISMVIGTLKKLISILWLPISIYRWLECVCERTCAQHDCHVSRSTIFSLTVKPIDNHTHHNCST